MRHCLGSFPGKLSIPSSRVRALQLTDCDLDSVYYLRLRSCSHDSSSLCYRLGLYVLGIWNSPIIWRCSGDFEYRRQSCMEIAILFPMDMASTVVLCGLFCPRIALECRPARQDRPCKTKPEKARVRFTRQGGRGRGELGLYQAHDSP